MYLVDTDVLIDCLRGVPPALAWLAEVPREELRMPGIVAMELVNGCRDAAQLRQVQAFMRQFLVVWPDVSELEAALDLLTRHRLSTGIGMPDAIIAALAVSRRTPLFSFNNRHYQSVSGLDVRVPYTRGAV